MDLFRIGPDDGGWAATRKPRIEARHESFVPGVTCPICGVWAYTGIQYPTIGADAVELGRSPMEIDEFDKLRASMKETFNATKPLLPGAKIGCLRGRASGGVGDFAWVNTWTVLVRRSIFERLQGAGLDLVGIAADLKFRKKDEEPLVELEALPSLHLDVSLIPAACRKCGRLGVTMPEKLRINSKRISSGAPLQRIYEIPTVLLINLEMARLVQSWGLTDIVVSSSRVECI